MKVRDLKNQQDGIYKDEDSDLWEVLDGLAVILHYYIPKSKTNAEAYGGIEIVGKFVEVEGKLMEVAITEQSKENQ